jgi:glyoxylase-like metal-dependent hydrolase (beta-lactamase superfamily II)
VETRRILLEQAGWDWNNAALDARVAQGIEIAFCRDMLKAELPDRSGLVLRPSDIAFTNTLEIDLGCVTCRLIHVGGDHAADSTIVFVPEERVVFLSDCRYEDLYVTPRRYTTAKAFRCSSAC